MTAAASQDSDWKAALDIKPATSMEYSEMKAPSAAGSYIASNRNVPSSSSYMVSSKPRLPNAIPGSGMSSGGTTDPYSTPCKAQTHRRRRIQISYKTVCSEGVQKCENMARRNGRSSGYSDGMEKESGTFACLEIVTSEAKRSSSTAANDGTKKMARVELRRRQEALYLLKATHLACVCQRAWRERKDRLLAARVRADREARLLKRKIRLLQRSKGFGGES